MSNQFFFGFADELVKMAEKGVKFKGMDANGRPIFEPADTPLPPPPPTQQEAPKQEAPAKTTAPAPAKPKLFDPARKALRGGYGGVGSGGESNRKALEEANKR